jgi:hypothetical protein
VVQSVIADLTSHGAFAILDESTDAVLLNGELRVSIVLCRHQATPAGAARWMIRLDDSLRPDITIAVRMEAGNEHIRDYYLLPACDLTFEKLRIAEDNGVHLDGYRFENLDYFFEMAERARVEEAA